MIANVALRLKPSVVVVENVLAFLTRRVRHPSDGKPISAANYLASALSTHYVMFPLVADLCDYGVPQTRTRAFLTFIRRDLPGLGSLLRLGRAPYPRPTCGREYGGPEPTAILTALASFGLPDLDAVSPESAAVDGYNGLHAVPAWNARTYAMVAAIQSGSGRSAWDNDKCVRCGQVDVSQEDAACPKCGDALLRPVVREADGSIRLIRGFKTSYRRMYPDRAAATVTTASGHLGSDFTIHPTQNRLLSTLECALLQTFPPRFSWGNALQKWGHTNIREMIGEAVPPAFTQMHGEVLAGVCRQSWTRAPISLSDERVARAWNKLAASAKNDHRRDPRARAPVVSAKLRISQTPELEV